MNGFLRGTIVSAILFVGAPAFADSIGRPHSYKQVAPGGKFVFVMVTSGDVEEEASHWIPEKAAEIREIRRTCFTTVC